MKIAEAVDRIRELKPNQFSDARILHWLSDLDRNIWHELIRHFENTAPEGATDNDGNPITDLPEPGPYEMVEGDEGQDDTLPDETLLVPEPYSELYMHYLAAQMDYWKGEHSRYNNSIMLYAALYQAFTAEYTSTHTAKALKLTVVI